MKKNSNTDAVECESDSESERFVDFARRIVNVPKEEIDAQQAIYEAERAQKRRERELATE